MSQKIRYTQQQLIDLARRNLRKYRERAGLSQCKLAKLAGTMPGWINDIERGRRRGLSLGTVAPLAAALGVHPALLLLPPPAAEVFLKMLTNDEYRALLANHKGPEPERPVETVDSALQESFSGGV